MNETKILFTDLDGTLLNDHKKISEHTLEMIHRMTALGHKFVLSSGRPINSVLAVAEEFGFTGPGSYVSAFNGGLIYDCYAQNTLLRSPIPMKYVRHIFDYARKAGMHAHTYTATHITCERETAELKHYREHIKMPVLIVEDVTTVLKEEPMKIIVMDLNGRENLEQFRTGLEIWASNKVSSTFSSPFLLEYGSLSSTKGNGVKFLCDYFNIPIENAIAAGDEENDVSMLEVAGVGVAMCNATDFTKKAADYVTKNDNNHDGLSEIIEKYILNT